jgi:hypothetical protein
MRRYLILLICTGLLVGCAATPAERAANVKKEVEEMIEVYGPGCEKLGFTKDSDPWRQCILRLQKRDEDRYRTRPTTTTCVGHRGFYNCTSF